MRLLKSGNYGLHNITYSSILPDKEVRSGAAGCIHVDEFKLDVGNTMPAQTKNGSDAA